MTTPSIAASSGAPFLMTADEIASVGLFQGRIAAHFTLQRRFGVAGGPDEIVLSDQGWEIAYDMAAIYRVRLKIPHIRALELLHAAGESGLAQNTLSKDTYVALRQIDAWLDAKAFHRSLAASLANDECRYREIRESNRLLFVAHDVDRHMPVYYLTALGRELIRVAHAVGQNMIAARQEHLAALH
ncbi:hypothetical protein [Noviherbaspirillum galbum]|uniref:Uncharacterized protein n=1 Tax=Noviherbaspirillum galbum TaxID=2709383 RepID=A0A6B3SL99_9BURK|nr:hypothetical protein [Noviherbaspirillum galbum]NEX60145.1 hypothetical protein [Noviherbaspirillum galbum]